MLFFIIKINIGETKRERERIKKGVCICCMYNKGCIYVYIDCIQQREREKISVSKSTPIVIITLLETQRNHAKAV